MQLTNKQKELFQLDKYVLVDTIIILENKLKEEAKYNKWLEKACSSSEDSIKYLKNEMLLNVEALKTELETERNMCVKLEKAYITSQEEIDVLGKDVDEISQLDNDSFLCAVQDKIDKFRRESLTSREKVIEEGENGAI